tara:strand:- start:608 stop:853 length:246 start_codon:yes stop_codon:yes gene_type:complete
MNEQLEAIREAVYFIQDNWIGETGAWRGEASEFVGAIVQDEITRKDVRHLIEAINEGEPIELDGLGGSVIDGRLTDVWVTK